jgi:hypothetical protein
MFQSVAMSYKVHLKSTPGITLVELEAVLLVPTHVEQRDAVRAQAANLRVGLLVVGHAAHKVFAGHHVLALLAVAVGDDGDGGGGDGVDDDDDDDGDDDGDDGDDDDAEQREWRRRKQVSERNTDANDKLVRNEVSVK